MDVGQHDENPSQVTTEQRRIQRLIQKLAVGVAAAAWMGALLIDEAVWPNRVSQSSDDGCTPNSLWVLMIGVSLVASVALLILMAIKWRGRPLAAIGTIVLVLAPWPALVVAAHAFDWAC